MIRERHRREVQAEKDFADRRSSSCGFLPLTARWLRGARIFARCGWLVGFDESSGEERHENFVMAGERVAAGVFGLAADFFGGVIFCGGIRGGAADDVLQWAIVLEEIEIGGGDGTERSAEIARDGDGFEKNFRENDGRAPVEINAAGLHFADEGAEELEVVMRGGAEIFSGSAAMNVGDVRADGEMDGDGNFCAIGSGENALVEMAGACALVIEDFAGGFAEADAGAACESGHFVDDAAGFVGHAEFAFAEDGFDVFGSASDHGDFEIVDERGAVHGDAGDEAAAEKVDEDRAEADFDDVSAHTPENGTRLRAGFDDGLRDGAKVFGGEDARERAEKFGEGFALARRFGELADADFAGTRGERVGAEAVEVERLSFVEARRFGRQD
jgi:hypothetical protein